MHPHDGTHTQHEKQRVRHAREENATYPCPTRHPDYHASHAAIHACYYSCACHMTQCARVRRTPVPYFIFTSGPLIHIRRMHVQLHDRRDPHIGTRSSHARSEAHDSMMRMTPSGTSEGRRGGYCVLLYFALPWAVSRPPPYTRLHDTFYFILHRHGSRHHRRDPRDTRTWHHDSG